MDMNAQEARSSLTEIERITRDVRWSLAMRGTGSILIVWGLVWMVCFSLTQLYPTRYPLIWGVGNVAGIAGTILALSLGAQSVVSPRRHRFSWKFFWFWFGLFAFLNAGMAVLLDHAPSPQQVTAFVVLGIMFAYVVIGLMLDTWFMIFLGLAVTVLTVGGYFALQPWFHLWMAVTGGGALFFSGLHVHKRWR